MTMGIAARMSSAARFLSTGIWRVRLGDVHGPKRFLIRYLRIVLIAGKGFVQDKCTLWGSALTFYSILSIVPVFALGFAVAKGFGLEILLEDFLVQQFAGYEDVVTQVITFSRRLLARTSGGVIAGVGAVFLIWSVFQILSSAEQAFNNIWEVKKQRTLGRQLSDYLSIMLTTPVVLIISSSSLVFIATQLHNLLQAPGFIWVVSPVIFVLIHLIPYVLIWLLLTFVYVFLPNTRVNFTSAILGGVIAGTVFVIVQWVYITFQVGVSSYNAIYGSFAALPLFLVWLNLSWYIVLFGTELCYAHQNEELYVYEPEAGRISHSFRMLLSLQVVHLIVKHFMDGGRPLSSDEISDRLDIPPRTVREIIDSLVGSGLVTVVSPDGPGSRGYQPSRDIDFFTISHVVEALEDKGGDDIPVAKTESLERISKSLQAFRGMIEHSEANVRLKDI